MDERQLARLVEQVEQAFPGDPVAQRQAWEFIEVVLAAWDDAGAPALDGTAAAGAKGATEAGRGLLDIYRSVLRETGGRLASAVQVLFPPAPGLATLARAEPGPTIEVESEVADAAGLQGPVAVEYGREFLTLVARVTAESDPSRLGAIVHMADESTVVQRFERIEPTIATAHFDLPGTSGPVGVGVALFDERA